MKANDEHRSEEVRLEGAEHPLENGVEPLAQKRRKKKGKAKRIVEKKVEEPTSLTRGVETMFRTSYRQHVDLSSLADNKSNIMISINGIIISIIIASISPKIDANPWLLLPTSVLLLSCLVSMVFAILSARPRVSSTPITLERVRREGKNILFFGNFVNMSEPDYVLGMSELLKQPPALYEQMMRDIYSLGHVLARKFRLLRVSYTIFMFGLAAGVLLFIAVLIGVVVWPPGTTVPDTSAFP